MDWWLAALGAGSTLGVLASATLGYLLWRESRKRADAEKQLQDLTMWQDIAAALRINIARKDERIAELEKRLAEVDPGALFDDVFGVRP